MSITGFEATNNRGAFGVTDKNTKWLSVSSDFTINVPVACTAKIYIVRDDNNAKGTVTAKYGTTTIKSADEQARNNSSATSFDIDITSTYVGEDIIISASQTPALVLKIELVATE